MRNHLICFFLACVPLNAQDELFRERFADPETRATALTTLVPGTRTAYFYTALDHQLAGREGEFRKTMSEWKAAAEREENPVSSEGLEALSNRGMLKEYAKNPDGSRAELIRKLGLVFTDTRPDAAAAAENLPTRVDPALITEAAFEKATLGENPEAPYEQYKGGRLLRELENVEKFDETKIRWFFENIGRADLPGVVPLMDRMLSLNETFSSADDLSSRLTAEQLKALLVLHPDLKQNESFCVAYLGKLRPGAETDFSSDPQAHAGHLRRCRDFVITLPPALNSLKAHVLFHHLRLQAEMGNFPKEDFLAYISLPRRISKMNFFKHQDRSAEEEIDLASDFSSATGCGTVDNDNRVVNEYLHHFLSSSDSAADFAPFIEEMFLKPIHARARLLGGGDPAVWGKLLDPSEFNSLQEEAEIAVAKNAPVQLSADAAVALTLDLKNTPDLLIRIYELDLPAHLANQGVEPEVGIDLDGLVPHHERRISYAQAPILRHRETITLPELAGPGAWIVDFTGGQVSGRALIRKGRLIAYPERNATGQSVRVFDEKHHPVPTASLTLGREKFSADENGRIVIPDAANQPVTRGVLSAGKLATAVSLESRGDELAMDARFHLDREQLLADQEAKLHLRVRLTNHGHELPLDRIKDPALVLKAELLGGITTERVIAENLNLTPVMEIPFQVPAGLLKLTLALRGTVTPATGGEPLKLSGETGYEINSELQKNNIGTAFFSPTTEGHRLEIRGRNGEPLPSRELALTFIREDYEERVRLQVRTDAEGRVDLGKLDTIDFINASGSGITGTAYSPRSQDLFLSRRLQVPVGQEIRLPLEQAAAVLDHERISFLETLEGEPIRDHFDKLAIEGGDLVIRGLPPGDFRLQISGRTTGISVSSGVVKDGLILSQTRIQPLHAPSQPTVAHAGAGNGELRLQLRGAGPDTSVSVVGRRYQHWQWGIVADFRPFSPTVSDTVEPGFVGCGYLTERRLSDEMRYILDRRAAMTFPGSLLPRPGLLLNRWTDAELAQEQVDGGEGVSGSARGALIRGGRRTEDTDASESRGDANRLETICDFLQFPSTVRYDLKPEKDGSLKLPLADFSGSQFIEIIAADKFASDSVILPLPADDTPLRDRRIARPFDSKNHYLANRSAAVLEKNAEAAIENVLDADWRAFTTLTEAHQFLYGMTGDDRLREFVFLTEWPNLTEEKKLELLKEHACHELHLFLARKDTAFFGKFVKPLLAGKPEPQFMDDYLLERDLTTYLRPYAWARLNAAEKALLARAMPAARERISRELSLRWQLEVPAPDQETRLFTQTLQGSDLALQDSLGLAKRDLNEKVIPDSQLAEKLRRMILPRIDFQDISLRDAVGFLREESVNLDITEKDPAKKGVNFVINDATGVVGRLRIRELKVRNIPLDQALKYICDSTKLRYRVGDSRVTFGIATEAGDEIITRTFKVEPDFASVLDGGEDASTDPFAEAASGGGAKRLTARKPIQELLKANGIVFSEGSSATLSGNGTLIITNTPDELEKIGVLTQYMGSDRTHMPEPMAGGFPDDGSSLLSPLPEPAEESGRSGEDFISPVNGTSIDGIPADPAQGYTDGIGAANGITNGLRSGDQAINRNNIDAILNNPSRAAADPFSEASNGGAKKLVVRRSPPVFPNGTKLWREANYYHSTKPTDESLIPLNRFWLDLAAWNGEGPFLSPHFNACHTNANESLMCLALLDLPFKADRPEVAVDGSTLRVKAREPMLLFYKDTRKTEDVVPESPLLVRQTFSPQGEPFRKVNGRQVENPVTGDFRPGVAYVASLIVTNPTGIGRRIDVLAQIPAGAIPLGGKPATESSTHELQPYGVVTETLAFYFPAAGDFAVYPLHVSENGRVLAHTDSRALRVSNDPAPQDSASWQVLAAEGTDAEVLSRLGTENLDTIHLKAIRWRLKDAVFFQSVAKLLRDRLHFSADVASYGFHHNDVAAMREYLENSDAVKQLGDWLDSPLLEVRPRVHLAWETLEFDPLVNPRAHRFATESRLTHEAARGHYLKFLAQLGWKPVLDDEDELNLALLLFLQDRTGEALARFDKIDPAKLPGRMNYDYLHSVVLFHREKPAEARAIAERVLPDLPPGIWRDRFQAVIDQAEEIAALAESGAEETSVTETAAPELDLSLADGGKLTIKHRSLEKATLRLFSVDLEVLFSKNPFLKGEGEQGGLPAILPNGSFDIELAKDASETAVELPEGLRKGNVLVSADSGSRKLLKVLDSKAIELRHMPQDRIVQVLGSDDHKPLPKTYVKVYAETNSGQVVFHKDGYTDLRGKFDYLSHTGIDTSTIKRVAVLVTHPEEGARTVIYDR
ncbi:hypothetical protein JIN84_22575 [Luteolibacter yonseiensis]|uniref:Uncharacterized protein n=1 Tax=Luteolibacter yonseiensis TaxID=1144680 RepID=A0A934VDV4_9BACT|nr:hypothetical protein [Luteolibacter yonseiensis]MBK1818421.1 hypothetical protein [Luteolibacter yonseiensis]